VTEDLEKPEKIDETPTVCVEGEGAAACEETEEASRRVRLETGPWLDIDQAHGVRGPPVWLSAVSVVGFGAALALS